ncbi:MAG: hypothetical protein KatS3mg038_0144 [Candidatus Kapaibacterium sp.]|nr:MAG: hypothetical protein KatS3mg038_0144 [Candidatus Kapabacteria bacterium]
MTRQQNILTGPLRPHTIGEMIDALIITNIRMWHEQEKFFDLEKLRGLPCDRIVPLLTYTTRLNLLRNRAMDGVDALLADQLSRHFPEILQPTPPPNNDSTTIWEPT